MAKRLTKIIAMGVLIIISLSIFGGCGDNKPTEQAQSGAYFVTGSGSEFAVVHEDKLSVFFNGERCDVFQFAKDGDSYLGENVRAKATIKFIGDELRIVLSGVNGYSVPSKNLRLKRNADIGLSETATIQLAPPENIECSKDTITDSYSNISWGFEEGRQSSLFLRQNGILGAGIEIKRPNSEDFVVEKISDYIPEPYCLFGIVIKDLNLTQGLNILRIKHLGGAFLQSDNKIRLSEDSSEIYFNITVDFDGNITEIEQMGTE